LAVSNGQMTIDNIWDEEWKRGGWKKSETEN
jgi:hypothetical protein